MTTTALVLNYNNAAFTREAVRSLLAQTRPPELVLVVDNGSMDESADELDTEFADEPVEVLRLRSNLGIPGALAAGMRRALEDGAEFVHVQHNDTNLEPGALELLRERLVGDPRCAAVAPVQVAYHDPGIVLTTGGWLTTRWRAGHYDRERRIDEISQAELDSRRPEWLDFTCLLIRADALREVGLPRPEYQFYWEDVDWGHRVTIAGWHLGTVADARLRHRVGATLGTLVSPTFHYLNTYNRYRSARLNGRTDLFSAIAAREVPGAVYHAVRQRNVRVAALRLRATRDALAQRAPVLPRGA